MISSQKAIHEMNFFLVIGAIQIFCFFPPSELEYSLYSRFAKAVECKIEIGADAYCIDWSHEVIRISKYDSRFSQCLAPFRNWL